MRARPGPREVVEVAVVLVSQPGLAVLASRVVMAASFRVGGAGPYGAPGGRGSPQQALKNPSARSVVGTRTGSARSPAGRAQRGHRRPRAQPPRRRAGEHRAARCTRRIADLDRQRTQVRLGGRTFMSTSSCRRRTGSPPPCATALEAELPPCGRPSSGPGSTCARPARSTTDRGHARPDRRAGLARRDPQGAGRARGRGRRAAAGRGAGSRSSRWSPTCRTSQRLAYVGIDNRAAGATAAYLSSSGSATAAATCSSR